MDTSNGLRVTLFMPSALLRRCLLWATARLLPPEGDQTEHALSADGSNEEGYAEEQGIMFLIPCGDEFAQP